jgi:hypothetical protein
MFDGFSDEDNNTSWLLRLELDRGGVHNRNTVIARIDGKKSRICARQVLLNSPESTYLPTTDACIAV